MSTFKKELMEVLYAFYSFYLSEEIANNFKPKEMREDYLKQRSIFLNLLRIGDHFGISKEDNIALYKFLPFPVYIKNPEVSPAWHELFVGDKTNEDVLRYFCLANKINYDSFPQADTKNYDKKWYSKWLATPIVDFESFGLSPDHAMTLSNGGPCW